MGNLLWSVVAAAQLLVLPRFNGIDPQKPAADSYRSDFGEEKGQMAATGRSPYFILEPGYQMILEGGGVRLVVTVLDQTKNVDGVETRIVEERETKAGKLVEVSRNYFAYGRQTKNIYYFGEAVDMYQNGKVVSHEGAWISGVNGAKFGILVPGKPKVKDRYYQEKAPKVAMDRGEVVSVRETIKTPAGEFKDCLKVAETTPLEPGTKEYKVYAPGVGLVQDGDLKLVKHGKAAAKTASIALGKAGR
jgi:hypothetical protein